MIPQAPPAADSLRAVLDTVFAAPAYDWQVRPHPLAFLARWWRALVDWLFDLKQTNPALYAVVFWVLVTIVVAILGHAAYVRVQTVRAAQRPAAARLADAPARRDARWFRAEAERHAAAGRHALAMQADFLALALELDQRALVRYHPSTPPAEYAREARLGEAARGEFRELVRGLYRVAFGGAAVTADEVAAWRARSDVGRYAGAH